MMNQREIKRTSVPRSAWVSTAKALDVAAAWAQMILPGSPASVTTGSPAFSQARIPPDMLRALMPCELRSWVTVFDRPPERQTITAVTSRGISSSLASTWPMGMKRASGAWPADHSSDSRTSMTTAPAFTRSSTATGSISTVISSLEASSDRFSVCFQLFGVLAATELNPRAPTNGNHTDKRQPRREAGRLQLPPALSAVTPE